jgi:hypothetical protein
MPGRSAVTSLLLACIATFASFLYLDNAVLHYSPDLSVRQSGQTKLKTLLFSSFVDAFPEDLWMIKLAIHSYVYSFKVDKWTTSLSIRIQCQELRTPFGNTQSAKWHKYIDGMEEIVYWSTKYFNHVDLECASTLAAAYCSALYDEDYPFYFFLEHDWFFVPQMMNHTMNEIMLYLDDPTISYIRFSKARNHRRCMKNAEEDPLVVRLMEHLSVRMEMATDYTFSQNPHIASAESIRLIADSTCRVNPPVSHSLFEGILTENCQRPFIGSQKYDFKCSHCNCNLMDKFRPCRFFVYGNKDVEQTVFHMDGRRFHEYKSQNKGLFYGSDMRKSTQLYINGSIEPENYIRALGASIIAEFPNIGPGETSVIHSMWKSFSSKRGK